MKKLTGDDYLRASREAHEILTVTGLTPRELKKQRDELVRILKICSHALRSYQYGNSAVDLAEECANVADDSIRNVEDREENTNGN